MQKLLKLFSVTISFSLISLGALYAAEWNIKSTDKRISGSELKNLVTGKTIFFPQSSSQEIYKLDGTYEFKFRGKAFPSDYYEFHADGRRCITTQTGRRCDLYVYNSAGKLMLINQKGQRYKARVK